MNQTVESSRTSQYINLFCFTMKYLTQVFEYGALTHLSNHIPLRLVKALWSFGHSECNMTLTVEASHTSQYIRLFCLTMKWLCI